MTPDNFRQAVPLCTYIPFCVWYGIAWKITRKKSLLKWFCTTCIMYEVQVCVRISINLLLTHASINLMNLGSELLFCSTQKASFTFFQIEQINC